MGEAKIPILMQFSLIVVSFDTPFFLVAIVFTIFSENGHVKLQAGI